MFKSKKSSAEPKKQEYVVTCPVEESSKVYTHQYTNDHEEYVSILERLRKVYKEFKLKHDEFKKNEAIMENDIMKLHELYAQSSNPDIERITFPGLYEPYPAQLSDSIIKDYCATLIKKMGDGIVTYNETDKYYVVDDVNCIFDKTHLRNGKDGYNISETLDGGLIVGKLTTKPTKKENRINKTYFTMHFKAGHWFRKEIVDTKKGCALTKDNKETIAYCKKRLEILADKN